MSILPDNSLAAAIAEALTEASVSVTPGWLESGDEEWPSWFAVTDLAAASIGAASAEVAAYLAGKAGTIGSAPVQPPQIDRRLASLWFRWSLAPEGWQPPGPWDAIAGDYPTQTGWIKLHTNAPHHRRAALQTLQLADTEMLTRDTVARAVLGWDKEALEQAIVSTGGCAAAMRSMADWQAHPQGQALAAEPLIIWQDSSHKSTGESNTSRAGYPLAGIRVLDLTRVLAGPVASRFLARYGADVLRVDPPNWEEPGVIPEVTLGKRCCGLDLTQAEDRKRFERLLQQADILLHGYRPGALARLGYDRSACLAINPDLIDVSLCAYGHSGPWAERRGFDSLVQMSSGIAAWGMQQSQSASPSPLPVQALDHATGYLMAAAALRALRVRREQQKVLQAKLSLARTALLLATSRRNQLLSKPNQKLKKQTEADLGSWIEDTSWGEARRLRFPVGPEEIEGVQTEWQRPATKLRSSEASWL